MFSKEMSVLNEIISRVLSINCLLYCIRSAVISSMEVSALVKCSAEAKLNSILICSCVNFDTFLPQAIVIPGLA